MTHESFKRRLADLEEARKLQVIAARHAFLRHRERLRALLGLAHQPVNDLLIFD
jgi:hypothetical protein